MQKAILMRPAVATAFQRAKVLTAIAVGVPAAIYGAMAGMAAMTAPDDLEFVGAASEAPAVPLNPPKFGPFTEDETQRRGAPTVTDMNSLRHVPVNNATDELGGNHTKLVRNRLELDAVLRDCAREVVQPCAPGLQKYQQMVQEVRTFHAPYLQAMVINAWVNSAIRYDNEEVGSSKRRNLDEALLVGKGVCDEQAQLKLHALQAVGFKPDDTRYVVGNVVQNGMFKIAHAVATVRINDQSFVLDNQMSGEMPPHAASFQAVSALLNRASRLKTTTEMYGANPEQRSAAEKFLPVYAMNYQTAAPYTGMASKSAAPFYVGRRLKQPHNQISDISLGVGLSKIDAGFRPVVSSLLMDAFDVTATKPEIVTMGTVINAQVMRAEAARRSASSPAP